MSVSKKRKSKFSVFSLIALFTFITMGLTIWYLNFQVIFFKEEVATLKSELKIRRKQLGVLDVEDANKVHVINVPTDYPLEWKWSVYIPSNVKFRLVHANNRIPSNGLAGKECFGGNEWPKRFTISLRIVKDSKGEWRSEVSTEFSNSIHRTSRVIPKEAISWLSGLGNDKGTRDRGVFGDVVVDDVGKPVELLRRRLIYSGKAVDIPGETDGLLLWFETTGEEEE